MRQFKLFMVDGMVFYIKYKVVLMFHNRETKSPEHVEIVVFG